MARTSYNKDKNNSKIKGRENRRSSFRFLLVVFIVLFIAVYISNDDFRTFVDKKIIRKEVEDQQLKNINVVGDTNFQVFAYNRNIAVLKSGVLHLYDKDGLEKENKVVSIGSAVSDNNGRNLVIGEKEGPKLIFVENDKIKWERNLNINITGVTVTKSGYISVIGKSSLYKSIVIVMNNKGDILLKKYSSDNLVIKTDISSNEKLLLIGSVNYSKASIVSQIEIISIDKAIKEPKTATIEKYTKDRLLVDLKFKGSDQIQARYNDQIMLYNKNEKQVVFEITEDIEFIDIGISDGFYIIEKYKSNIFTSNYQVKIFNSTGNQIGMYVIGNTLPKNTYSSYSNIVLELHRTIEVTTSRGWLKKKYNSERDILSIAYSDNIIAIIYNDRIDILEI